MSLASTIDFVKRSEELGLAELVGARSGVTTGLECSTGPRSGQDLSLIVEVDGIRGGRLSGLFFFFSVFLTGSKFYNISTILIYL